MTFLEAVGRMEGVYAIGSRPQRNNNPGDIEYGKFAQAHGATGSDGRFAIFPSLDAGYSAMRALFEAPSYKGLTVAAALNRWAPAVENNTNHYISAVCAWVPCSPTDIVDTLL